MRRTVSTTITLTALLPALLLGGCGSSTDRQSSSGGASGSPGTSSTASGPVVDVTVHGNKVSPNGDRINAEVGRPITLQVTSDRDGELHVHSTPEQELRYKSGKTTLKVTIDKPGIVDIEDHVADVVVVQLQVS